MTTSPSDEFLADLEQVLKDQGVEPDKARAAAVAIGVQWAGQSVYIRLRGLYLARAIAAAFDGSNAGELATRFRVSRAQVYKLLARVRGADKPAAPQLEQARLPGT